jgi:hypothetical protein
MAMAQANSWGRELKQARRQVQLSHLLNNQAELEPVPCSAGRSRVADLNSPLANHIEVSSVSLPTVLPSATFSSIPIDRVFTYSRRWPTFVTGGCRVSQGWLGERRGYLSPRRKFAEPDPSLERYRSE